LNGQECGDRRGIIWCSLLPSYWRPWGPPSLLYDGYRLFPEVKRSARGVDQTPPSSAEVKETIQQYLYSSFGPSRPVLGRALSFTLYPVIGLEEQGKTTKASVSVTYFGAKDWTLAYPNTK